MSDMITYHSVNQWLQKKYGCKVYKIALDAGCTCPNRDGTKGVGGCLFCSVGGSGEFAGRGRYGRRDADIEEQLCYGKQLLKNKLKGREARYIAYFQAFTNTYGDPAVLKDKYLAAARDPEVCILSIATRPDCLNQEILIVLSEINRLKPVWIELGLQTIHEDSAKRLHRAYNLEEYDCAVQKLKELGIYTITHVILGLPGESKAQIIETVEYVCRSGVKGIKLQLLHVLKGTGLEAEYEAGLFSCLELEEYKDILVECIAALPPDMIVHRITGDGDKNLLVAPLWSADKKRVLNYLHRFIREAPYEI